MSLFCQCLALLQLKVWTTWFLSMLSARCDRCDRCDGCDGCDRCDGCSPAEYIVQIILDSGVSFSSRCWDRHCVETFIYLSFLGFLLLCIVILPSMHLIVWSAVKLFTIIWLVLDEAAAQPFENILTSEHVTAFIDLFFHFSHLYL